MKAGRGSLPPPPGPARTLVVKCRDWPILAAGYLPSDLVVVTCSQRVVATSAAARRAGVGRGQRRREAESLCPALVVLDSDPEGEARAFEAVVASVEAVTTRIEVVRPGELAFLTLGPSRYFGGDESLARRVGALADTSLDGRANCQVGIADGFFAASVAASHAPLPPAPQVLVVERGNNAAFLAPLPTTLLADQAPQAVEIADLVALWHRLGMRTLGDLAALPPADVLGRFGPEGARAHRQARGLDERLFVPVSIPPELSVSAELDPPTDRLDTVAFLARSLAGELSQRLAVLGLACTCVSIEVETEYGESSCRLWRAEGGLTPTAMAERARWQLEGWLKGAGRHSGDRPTAGITRLRLVPDRLSPAVGRQLGLWGGTEAADEQAGRGIARAQGLLGPDAVMVAARGEGRGPGEQMVLVPAHTVAFPRPNGDLAPARGARPPWPGQLPAPSPALVHPHPLPVRMIGPDGTPVSVAGRGTVSALPAQVAVAGRSWVEVVTWAGPWPVDERWWDRSAHRRRARAQVVTAAGDALLLVLEDGQWTVEATYD